MMYGAFGSCNGVLRRSHATRDLRQRNYLAVFNLVWSELRCLSGKA
jgi:hypothetical protein